MNKRLLWLGLAWSVAHQISAESFTTNIIDGVSTNITTEFVLGDTGPHNFLLITNAGAMTNHARVFIGNTVEAHNNAAVVSGIGSVWHLDDTAYVGLRSPSNTLSVLGGANVRAERPLALGLYETASNNVLRVAGIQTSLNGNTLHLGIYGAGNEFLVEDFAIVQLGDLIFNTEGTTNGGRQVAIVRGLASQLWITNLLQIGNSPENVFILSNTASVFSRTMTLGVGPRSHFNRAELSGPGATWYGGDFVVGTGLSSSNTVSVTQYADFRAGRFVLGQSTVGNDFVIDSGGRLSPGQLIIGERQDASHNRLEIGGPGSTLSNITSFTIGESGTDNAFRLYGGAYAYSGNFGLGMQFTSSNNLAIASGTNTVWFANRMTVGSAGDFNTLTIEDGANLFASSLLSGGQGGSGNATYVSGRGSLLSLTNGLDLGGDNNTGNLLVITNDARVESGSGVVGSYGYSNSAIITRGSWSNVLALTIGSLSTDNLLLLRDGARLYSSNAVAGVGDYADRNRVEVSGKGTAWRVVKELNVGAWGDSNEVAVLNGATISANSLNVGGYFVPISPADFPSDANRFIVHGTTTAVNVTSNVSLGYNGRWNRLEVRGGAQLNSGSAQVATRSGSAENTILVSDPRTRWHNTNAFVLGSNGYASTLIISNGATLRTGPTVLGATGITLRVSDFCTHQFGFNQAIIAGTGTTWQVDGPLSLGTRSASNSIIVREGAALRGADISIGQYGGTCGGEMSNLLGVDGGTLEVPGIFIAPRGQFRMSSGRANVGSLWVEGGQPGRVQILGGTLRPGSMYASAPAQIEIGDGVRRATLELIGGAYFSSGRIIVASNSVVAGRGSINPTNAGTYGTFGAITAITNATLQGCSGFDVWISGSGAATGHSMLNLVTAFGTPVLNGRLRVALNPSFQPQTLHEFPIVTFTSATGSFVNAPHESRLKTVDNLASFLVLYRPNAVVLTDYQTTDADGDAIEDQWATNHFGHSPLTSAERAADNDGDGFSNYDEFRAGTDPSDPASALRVSVTMTQGTATLRWPCVDGKTYRIYFSADMRGWREVSTPTFAFPQAGICEWTDDGRDPGSASGRMRFYRVGVE